MHGHAGQLPGAREQGVGAGLAFCRAHRPFRTRLGPRFGCPPVHHPCCRTARGRLDTRGVKFSIRQILASTAGAVVAAVILSVFGVKGTIVGVAIGSAAATMGTALVAQSIDRGHQVVKQVAVRAPESSTLLRRLGGTGASGPSTSSVDADASSAPTEVVGQSEPKGGSAPETVQMASTAAPAGETERVEIAATSETPATQRPQATTASSTTRPTARGTTPLGFSWRAIAGTAAIVFVLALLFITAIELISGKPLSTIFGGADTGTTLNNLVNQSPAPPTTPTSPTSTTSTTGASTSTTTTATSTTTSTTAPAAGATTTTPTTATTTTTGPALSGSTTTTPSSAL